MSKRTGLSAELLRPSPKRTKTSHERHEFQVFEDKPVNSPLNTYDQPGSTSKGKSGVDTKKLPSPNSQAQHTSEENAAIPAHDFVSTAPTIENGKEAQEKFGSRPSFIPVLAMPPLTWLTVLHQNSTPLVFPNPRQRLSRPRPRLPSPLLEAILRRQVAKKEEKPNRPVIEPTFATFRESGFTAFANDGAGTEVTTIEDENFAIALGDAHEFVEAYIQMVMFSYSKKLVDYIMPLAKTAGEVAPGEEATPLEKQLFKWKSDRQWTHFTVARRGNLVSTRGRMWFTAECVEELAELLEATVGEGDPDKILGREEDTEAELEMWKIRAFMICGYCQGKGIEGVKRKGNKHYARLGRAWKRIVDLQFMDNVWDQSQERVLEWRWHNKMMWKVVRSKGWTSYAELLRRRWMEPSNHPMAPINLRKPLEEVAEVSANGLSRDEEAWANFEVGLD